MAARVAGRKHGKQTARKPGRRAARKPAKLASPRGTHPEFQAALQRVQQHIRVLQVQFRRVPDMETELDTLRRVVERMGERISLIASSVAAIGPRTVPEAR